VYDVKLATVASVQSDKVGIPRYWRVREKWISAFKTRVQDKKPNLELNDLAAKLRLRGVDLPYDAVQPEVADRLSSHLKNLDTSDPGYDALLAEIRQFMGVVCAENSDSDVLVMKSAYRPWRDRAVQIGVFANELGGGLEPRADRCPARPDSIHAPEAGFIGEHDTQLPPAPGGSSPSLPYSIRKTVFLKAFCTARSRLG